MKKWKLFFKAQQEATDNATATFFVGLHEYVG